MSSVSIPRTRARRLSAIATLPLTAFSATTAHARQSARWTPFLGEWSGVATRRPDAGLPVSVRLTVRPAGDSVRVSIGLPESRQVDLAVPSPYSDSANMTLIDGVLRAELTPDIGYAFIGNLGLPREDERIILAVRRQGN